MASSSTRRSRLFVTALVTLLGTLVLTASAAAQPDTFRRFEVLAAANYTVTEDCADGSTAETLISIRAGHEEESQNGETTLDSDFLTVLIRGFDCDGGFVNDRGTGASEFTFTPSLDQAAAAGTIATRDGRTVSVDLAWAGVGGLETTHNTTSFPGFKGHFTGKRRDAVAAGTVVIDGDTVVDGSTDNAEIESLEDRNRSTS